ncbi:MAG: MerR family transcriptional regulator [Acidobacteria bacterium]|nr:MerR family transcriptional regulator [Acidobacteriota bacterium]
MAVLSISAFAEACNDVLHQLDESWGQFSKATPRTIRYYTQEGLLPAPAMEEGQARYGYEHLLRVLAVKLYQTQFIPLRLIRQRLSGQGKKALEQFITDSVLNRAGAQPVDAVAGSAPLREGPMISPRQPFGMIPHEIPREIPINPPEANRQLSPIVPIVYDDTAARMEYRVLTRSTLDATGLEADLNALGREGWWLVQILREEKRVLLVFMRWARRN